MNHGFRKPVTLPRMIAVFGIIVFACVAVMLVTLFLRPRSFTSFPEAIGYQLERRHVAYEHVYLDRAWPDTVNDVSYGATLVIQAQGRDDIIGRLDCRGWKTDCHFTVRAFGIYREPLPELSHTRRLPWVTWAEGILDEWAPQ